MDRRKLEAKTQLQKLQNECRSTVDLLNKLLQTCSTQVDILDNINSTDFRLHSQYFLAITQFQFQTYQKLLEININLEEHVVVKELPSLEQFYVEDVPGNSGQEEVQQGLIKVDLQLDLDVVHAEANKSQSEVDTNNGKTDVEHNEAEPTKTCISVEHNIIDKLKDLSESRIKQAMVLEPVPGVSLQPSQKKMSVTIEEKLVKCHTTKSLTDVDGTSSEEDFLVPNPPILDIKERHEPKVNDLCMIGHIESPSLFYIQVADENSSILDLLSAQLESLSCRNCANLMKPEAKQSLGNFCCMEIDNVWYRAEILDWMMNATGLRQDQVVLRLIDYGNTVRASYKKLCSMWQELFDIPKMAQLCHLDGLYPPGSKHKSILKKWPAESKDGFSNACGDLNSSVFQICHVSKDVTRNSFAIDLINTEETDGNNTIGQILLDANLAVDVYDQPIIGNSSIKNQILTSHGLQNIQPNMTRDEILELYFAENNVKEARTINEAVMDYDPQDEARTCRNLRKDGTCYKGDRCTLRHVPLKDGFTRDKHPVYNRAFVDTPMPFAGDEVLLTISHVCDVQRFYAQIRNADTRNCGKPTINGLISDMNKPETAKLYRTLRYPPGLSQLVIVKHWNSHWYRGQVKNVTIPENCEGVVVEVCVVDFGDTLMVPMSDLRIILPEFLSIPFQAIECRLYNVKHRSGADEDEEKKYLESRFLGQTFKAKIIAVPGYLEVLLFTKDNEDIGEKMITAGYGEENTEHNFPKDNEIYLID